MDSSFFRKAKKNNRAVEYTNLEAIIPAAKDSPEFRVALPNRRPLTFEERQAAIDIRKESIATLEEDIIAQRKILLQLTKDYTLTNSGASSVVAQNLKIKSLMEQRAALAHPLRWIENIPGLTLKDIFESKRDVRKIGDDVFQIKRRVEPITSLYLDLGAAAAKETLQAESKDYTVTTDSIVATTKAAATAVATSVTSAVDTTAAALNAARGAIIGQRRTYKLKKPT